MSVRSPPTRKFDPAGILSRLVDLGPPSEIRGQAPSLAADALNFDRVVLSSIRSGLLTPEALHDGTDTPGQLLASLRERPARLSYPLIEGEIMRQRRARIVRVDAKDAGRLCAFGDLLGWNEYAAAPVMVEGQVIGFAHGDRRASGGPLEDADAVALGSFAICFGIVYERGVLRHRLRIQHQEMRQMASWATARTSELGDRQVTLDDDGVPAETGTIATGAAGGDTGLRDLLTRRELEVLKLMVRGQTNAAIARDLVLSEGTVKFHVKNILRKLHAANRAEATSRYMRLTLNRAASA